MPPSKRARSLGIDSYGDEDSDSHDLPPPPTKRRRITPPPTVPQTDRPTPPPTERAPLSRTSRNILSDLPNELLVRILSFLPLNQLLAVAPVSRRFYHLAGDSQLWKALYYARFVLPRARRIPGFRESLLLGGTGAGHKLHYTGRKKLWVDGRRGGVVREEDGDGLEDIEEEKVNWKRQYKLRYNWARGKCAVEELRIGAEVEEGGGERKVLAKVIEGIAITVDKTAGLRAWDLKRRALLARIELGGGDRIEAAPRCLAVDDGRMGEGLLDVGIGFVDGSFGVWRLRIGEKRLVRRYRHEKSSNGELIAMALSYPYLLTATASVLVSLYTFEVPSAVQTGGHGGSGEEVPIPRSGNEGDSSSHATTDPNHKVQGESKALNENSDALDPPYLLSSLNSHTSRPPLALSIRRAAATTVASIAYTFTTRNGWSIGIQNLHIRPSSGVTKAAPQITTTQIAYADPAERGTSLRSPTPASPPQSSSSSDSSPDDGSEPGPTALSYAHPYLLATLPDNTLVLYVCTSHASSLYISSGIVLWGHTSGISDAQVTARGKAVSVCSRGEEMRVWELEGRLNTVGSRSVKINPDRAPDQELADDAVATYDWDERRNWVGFDDEMVIVLKEKSGGGGESLMVYDFT